MAKIWNVSDHPKLKSPGHVRAIYGKLVAPGHCAQIDDEVLEGATKLEREIAAGLLFVGDLPPADYRAAKGQIQTRLPRKAIRSHGISTGVAPEVQKVELTEIVENVVVTEKVKVELTPSSVAPEFRSSKKNRGK